MNTLKLLFLFFPLTAFAAGNINTTIDILARPQTIDTTCATEEFRKALADSATRLIDSHELDYEIDSESKIQNWIYSVFQSPETLGAVLACPEIVNANDTDTVRFESIDYTFQNGREIVVNYETQPKVLHQRFMLATKNELPSNDPNPAISSVDPHATWTNTNPAWYGIMVVQSGALRDMVGPGKNNVVSAHYIYDNIHKLYPRDMAGMCSTRSGMMAKVDGSMVHKVMHDHTAKHPDDNNNYYIAGKINLQWISLVEIVADIVLTVVSWGGYAGVSAGTKVLRAKRIFTGVTKNLKALVQIKEVQQYVRESLKVAKMAKEIDNMNDMRRYITNIEKLKNTLAKLPKESKQYQNVLRELQQAEKLRADNMWKLGKNAGKLDNVNDIDNAVQATTKEMDAVKDVMKEMARTDKNVAEYVRQFDALKDVNKTLRELRAFRRARTGNMFVRGWKGLKNIRTTLKTANKSGKVLDRAARTARHGAKSGRVRDWLFHSTMKNIGRVTRVGEELAALYFVVNIIGDMYDWTNTENDEFTNGINLRPWLLLSADDIEGQDNVVNYGMWLMWTGDSTSEEDDDAAYLQAMDFAQKFHQDLMEVQEEDNRYACDVDIYVVRPIIRNPDRQDQALYWLFMNEVPWTTADCNTCM